MVFLRLESSLNKTRIIGCSLAKMAGFFGIWLPISVSTFCAVLYRYLSGLNYTSVPIISAVVIELAALVVWVLYWMVLYPNYFTPFRHLPTPVVCIETPNSTETKLKACLGTNVLVRKQEGILS